MGEHGEWILKENYLFSYAISEEFNMFYYNYYL